MSDNESDYYSDSSDSNEDTVKLAPKKNIVINAAKKFGTYIEDESEVEDSEPDDADADEEDEEQIGGEDNPDEEDDDVEEDPEGELTREDVAEIINRKKTNRLH